MTVIETTPKNPQRIGIEKITYSPGDYRESAGYNITFFRGNKSYCEYFQVGSAEILMELLGINIDEVKK